MDLFSPEVQEVIGGLTVVGLLGTLIIITWVALLKKWIVMGWHYKEIERRLHRTEAELEQLRTIAFRGTDIAERITRHIEREDSHGT